MGSPERGEFLSAETTFHVTVGREYPVLGLGIFETVLLALVCADTNKPRSATPVRAVAIGVKTMPPPSVSTMSTSVQKHLGNTFV